MWCAALNTHKCTPCTIIEFNSVGSKSIQFMLLTTVHKPFSDSADCIDVQDEKETALSDYYSHTQWIKCLTKLWVWAMPLLSFFFF